MWDRRGRLLGAVGAALVVVAASVLVLRSGTDDESDRRDGSVLVTDRPTEPLVAVAEPDRFVIEYRIEVGPAARPLVSTDRVVIDRPFSSRLEAFDPSAPGAPSSVSVSTFGRQAARSAGAADGVVVAAPPGSGLSDVRVLDVLADAEAAGRVERRERRLVLGRECDVYRSLTPLAVGDLLPAPGPDEATDTCVDAAGLVLEELSVAGGSRVSRRVAVSVDLAPDPTDLVFEVGDPTIPTEAGGGFLAELVPGSRAPGVFHEPGAPPAGFSLLGRYAVVPSQADNFADDDRRALRRTFVSDVFVDGIDLVVFDQGSSLGNVDPYPSFRGVPVSVPGFEDVQVSHGQSGAVVLARLGAGRFLRVRGSVPVSELVDVLAGAERVEGGELELADPVG